MLLFCAYNAETATPGNTHGAGRSDTKPRPRPGGGRGGVPGHESSQESRPTPTPKLHRGQAGGPGPLRSAVALSLSTPNAFALETPAPSPFIPPRRQAAGDRARNTPRPSRDTPRLLQKTPDIKKKKCKSLPRALADADNCYWPRHRTALRSVRTVARPPAPAAPLKRRGLRPTATGGPGHGEASESESNKTGRDI